MGKIIGEGSRHQEVQAVFNLKINEQIMNINFVRDNIGFKRMEFHTTNIKPGNLNFLKSNLFTRNMHFSFRYKNLGIVQEVPYSCRLENECIRRLENSSKNINKI